MAWIETLQDAARSARGLARECLDEGMAGEAERHEKRAAWYDSRITMHHEFEREGFALCQESLRIAATAKTSIQTLEKDASPAGCAENSPNLKDKDSSIRIGGPTTNHTTGA